MCEHMCSPHLSPCPPPWPSRRWNGGPFLWVCVRISLSWAPWGEEKLSSIYPTAQLEVSKLPFPLLSLLVRKGMLKSMIDWYTEVMDDFTNKSLCSECEGMHSRFVGKGGDFPLAVNSNAHEGSLSWCAHLHTRTVFINLCIHSMAGQKTRR